MNIYPDDYKDGFFWGFFLGIIAGIAGLIVAALIVGSFQDLGKRIDKLEKQVEIKNERVETDRNSF